MSSATIVLFRQDLRLDDNPALESAVRRGGPVVPAFIWAPAEEGEEKLAPAKRLLDFGPARPVRGIMLAPELEGRFFYNAELTGMNFTEHQGRFDAFLGEVLLPRQLAGALCIGLALVLIDGRAAAFLGRRFASPR